MFQVVSQPVSLILQAGASPLRLKPLYVDWQKRRYKVLEAAFQHSYRRGRRLIHVLSLNTDALDMRVELDSESFACLLTEISDGLPD